MTLRKTHLAVAVAATAFIGASALHAAPFDATTSVQSTLAVTAIAPLDLGVIFATETGATLAEGVAALTIAPDGTVTEPADSAAVTTGINLVSLGAPTPGQGSVDMINDFNLQLPNTSGIDPDDFPINTGTTLATISTAPGVGAAAGGGIPLTHSTGNPSVPLLYLMHFKVNAESGGTVASDTGNNGLFRVTQDFGETTFVFNIGATITTAPTTAVAEYEDGTYEGTFEVTASY